MAGETKAVLQFINEFDFAQLAPYGGENGASFTFLNAADSRPMTVTTKGDNADFHVTFEPNGKKGLENIKTLDVRAHWRVGTPKDYLDISWVDTHGKGYSLTLEKTPDGSYKIIDDTVEFEVNGQQVNIRESKINGQKIGSTYIDDGSVVSSAAIAEDGKSFKASTPQDLQKIQADLKKGLGTNMGTNVDLEHSGQLAPNVREALGLPGSDEKITLHR